MDITLYEDRPSKEWNREFRPDYRSIDNLAIVSFDLLTTDKWLGYEIMLESKEKITFAISNYPRCCEIFRRFRYIPNDIATSREGCIGLKVRHVSWAPNRRKGETAIRVHTDKGVLTLGACNFHNGYYPHNLLTGWPGYALNERNLL